MKTETKKEKRINELNAHYVALENLAKLCGINDPNGKKLSLKLWKLEQSAYKFILDYSNIPNASHWQIGCEPIRQEVKAIFNHKLQGFYINSDPRGKALKIDSEYFLKVYWNTGLTTDFVGNGILAPEFD